jgi:isovaleryl-CoA dehydrogenase
MIRSKIADMYVRIESMRLFTYQTLRAANQLESGGGGRGEIHKLTAASVMYASETMNKVLNEAVQIHGGTGYIWESEPVDQAPGDRRRNHRGTQDRHQ